MNIRQRFEQQLGELKEDVLKMGSIVENELYIAMDALERLDTARAHEVHQLDSEVNNTRYEIEEKCFALIVTQQPAARDLRAIVTELRATTELIIDEFEKVLVLQRRADALQLLLELADLIGDVGECGGVVGVVSVRRGASVKGVLGVDRIAADGAMEFLRRRGRFDTQFFAENIGASCVLTNGAGAVAGECVQIHELAVGVFARRVAAQDQRGVLDPTLILAIAHARLDQRVEHEEVHMLDALALVDAPLLIPALKEFTVVELDGPGHLRHVVDRQLGRRTVLHGRKGLLEVQQIEFEVSARVDLDPLRFHDEDGQTSGHIVQVSLQLP